MRRYTTHLSTSLLVLAVVAGCSSGGSGSRPNRFEEPTPVQVEKRDIIGYSMLEGNLKVPPGAVAVVYPPYHAPVERVLAAEGQRVNKGEVLLEISMPDVKASLEEARGTLKSAESALASAKVQYGATVRQLEQELSQARSRERTLREQARQTGDGSELQAAADQRVALEQQLAAAKAEMDANVQPYQVQYEQAKSAVELASSGAKQSSVRSPISGTVLELNAKAGQMIGQDRQERLARIVQLDAFQVEALADASLPTEVKNGTDAIVRFVGIDEVFEGRVVAVGKVPNRDTGATQQRITISFSNRSGLVKPEAKVESVGIATEKALGVLAVPNEAIGKDDSGMPYVQRMQSEQWVKTTVKTGITDGSHTQILEGLQENDTVLAPVQSVKDMEDKK